MRGQEIQGHGCVHMSIMDTDSKRMRASTGVGTAVERSMGEREIHVIL